MARWKHHSKQMRIALSRKRMRHDIVLLDTASREAVWRLHQRYP